MAWENVAKKQADLLTRLLDDGLTKWRGAKAAGGAYTADRMARDLVSVWSKAFDVWWGPFNTGDPVVPMLVIQSAPGNLGPVGPRDVRLSQDTTTAAVAITSLGLVGGNQLFTGNVAYNVTDGSKLQITITNVPALVPGTTNIYQGLALEGNEPIAVIMVKVG